MSLSWRPELRIGVCPDRLVLRDSVLPTEGDAVAALRHLAGKSGLTLVLSNHFVRYAVLPWSAALKSAQDWMRFARHSFTATYGSAAASWDIRVSPARRRRTRVASAVDRPLMESLCAIPGVRSVQPYLMSAFNARCRAFGTHPAWFVLHEAGRLAFALAGDAGWKVVRVRQADDQWREHLPELLDREAALTGDACDEAFVCAEEELPPRLGRYRIADLTVPPGARLPSRACVMAAQ